MPYISNPVYCGVGAIDAADRASALVRNDGFRMSYMQAFNTLARMSPAQVMAIKARVQATVQQLPASRQRQIQVSSSNAVKNIDPRGIPGLGQAAAAAAGAQAADWTAKLANIAGVIASLTTVGLGVATFIDSRKSSKAAQENQDRQQAAAEKQMAQDLAERKAALEITKAQADAVAKQKQLDAQGLTLDAQGNPIKKPTSSVATAGAIAAAVAGAFMISK